MNKKLAAATVVGAAGGVALVACWDKITEIIAKKAVEGTYELLKSDTAEGKEARMVVKGLNELCKKQEEIFEAKRKDEDYTDFRESFNPVGYNADDIDFAKVGSKAAKGNRAVAKERFISQQIGRMNNYNGHYRREGKSV